MWFCWFKAVFTSVSSETSFALRVYEFSAVRGRCFCGLRDLAELELIEGCLAFVGCFENARI